MAGLIIKYTGVHAGRIEDGRVDSALSGGTYLDVRIFLASPGMWERYPDLAGFSGGWNVREDGIRGGA